MPTDRMKESTTRWPPTKGWPLTALSLLSALAVTLSSWVLPASAHDTSSVRRASPSGQLAGHFTSASITSAEKVLAASGIATVVNESSSKALVKVHRPASITFTEPQVRAMALGAADGSGLSGSVLDAADPMPSGDPPLSYLLASWVSTSTTSAAKTMRKLMGTQDWKSAPAVVFPTIALPLFVGDVIVASRAPASSTTPTSASSAEYVNPNGPLSVEIIGLTDSPCSTVSSFIDDTLTAVANALMLGAPSGTGVGAKVGSFFVGLWNGAIALAQAAITGLVHAITGTSDFNGV